MLLGPPSLYSNFGASNNVINNGEGGGEGGPVEGARGATRTLGRPIKKIFNFFLSRVIILLRVFVSRRYKRKKRMKKMRKAECAVGSARAPSIHRAARRVGDYILSTLMCALMPCQMTKQNLASQMFCLDSYIFLVVCWLGRLTGPSRQ